MKKLGLVLLGVVAVAILLAPLDGCSVQPRPQSLDDKAQEIYRSLMCPICPGQTIDQSQSELSAQMRAVVRDKLERGEAREEILEFFVERYGEGVLAAPAKSGFNLAAWISPFAAIIVGGVIIWLATRKWVRRGKKLAPEVNTPSPGAGPDDKKYLAQVERDLKEFGRRGPE